MRIRITYGVEKTFRAGCFQRFTELRTLVEHRTIYFSNEALVLFAMPIDEKRHSNKHLLLRYHNGDCL